MNQIGLLIEDERLFDTLRSTPSLITGFKQVKKNRGKPGIDGVSILLSNVVLDELDQELEKRGLEFCRFADDCNIFVRSQKAADRVMDKVSQFIEMKLKLKVNLDKSHVAKSDGVKFLGFTVVNGAIAIAHKALQAAMKKVEVLTPRGTYKTLETTHRRLITGMLVGQIIIV